MKRDFKQTQITAEEYQHAWKVVKVKAEEAYESAVKQPDRAIEDANHMIEEANRVIFEANREIQKAKSVGLPLVRATKGRFYYFNTIPVEATENVLKFLSRHPKWDDWIHYVPLQEICTLVHSNAGVNPRIETLCIDRDADDKRAGSPSSCTMSEALEFIQTGFGNTIKELSITKIEYIEEEVLQKISNACVNSKIELSTCPVQIVFGLDLLGDRLEILHYLSYNYCESNTNELAAAWKKCTNLFQLNLEDVHQDELEVMLALPNANVQHLSVSIFRRPVDLSPVCAHLDKLVNLRTLRLPNVTVNQVGNFMRTPKPHLHYIYLELSAEDGQEEQRMREIIEDACENIEKIGIHIHIREVLRCKSVRNLFSEINTCVYF